jgi:hypothetical protein
LAVNFFHCLFGVQFHVENAFISEENSAGKNVRKIDLNDKKKCGSKNRKLTPGRQRQRASHFPRHVRRVFRVTCFRHARRLYLLVVEVGLEPVEEIFGGLGEPEICIV